LGKVALPTAKTPINSGLYKIKTSKKENRTTRQNTVKLKPIFQTIAENQYNLIQKFANNRTLGKGTHCFTI